MTVSQLAGLGGFRRERQLSLTIIERLTRGCCLYTYVAKTTMSSFRRVGTAFSGDSRTPGPFCSSAATLARFLHVEIF